MFHELGHDVSRRLENLQRKSKEAQLKRIGYRDFRELRIQRHWANR